MHQKKKERRKDETETCTARLGLDSNGDWSVRIRNHRKRTHREMVMKQVMSISELVEQGYPESALRQIARSQEFEEVGFYTGGKRKTYYFFVEPLNKLLKKGTWSWN